MPRPAVLIAALVFVQLAYPLSAAADPQKLTGIGDSISQGYSANGWLGEHPDQAFGQGSDTTVNSVYNRYHGGGFASLSEQFVSVSGAEMVGGSDNAAAQASRVCAQSVKPNRVILLLGGNDVCNRNSGSSADATSNMYSVTTYRSGLKAALDTLAGCLPQGSVVEVLSMPRVDYLYEAGTQKRSIYCPSAWYLASICRIVTGESDATRRRQIGARIDQYNAGLQAEVQAADAKYHSTAKVAFRTDWQGPMSTNPHTSVGSYQFSGGDINGADCFHPYYSTGQKKLACAAWEAGELGNPANIPTKCLTN